MTEVRRVSAPGSPFSGRERAIAAVVTIGVLAAILKPWGSDPGAGAVTPRPSARASAAATPAPVDLAGHAYDQNLFGPFEPAPDWSIWPAGYFVSVRYVTREAVDQPIVEPTASPAGRPSSSATPSAAPPASGDGPAWPPGIVVGPGDHLLWLGINTPLGWTIRDAGLRLTGTDGSRTEVPLTRLPTDWGDHFAVLGIPMGPASERLIDWPPGRYRLSITVDPGRITRTIEISIMTAPEPVAAPPAIVRP